MNSIFKFLPHEVDAFLLSTEDEFLGEYTLDCNKRLEFLTGFKGSYGFALIKKNNQNILFVDGRYRVQAQKEVKENFIVLPLNEFKNSLKDIKYALNIRYHSYKFIQSLQALNFDMVLVSNCPVDKIWKRQVNVSRETYNFELAGESQATKIAKILDDLTQKKADAILLTNPHDVCYLFNVRGKYLEYSPIAPCFAIVSRETSKVILPEDINNLKLGKVLLSIDAPYLVYQILKENNEVLLKKENIVEQHRMIKTKSEIDCIKKAHQEDSKALKQFATWLKNSDLKNETEYTVGEKLREFRAKQNGFVSESFPVIVGFKKNAAIVHYRATKDNAKRIEGSGLLLIDSGGQYYDKELNICGTTDITRVFSIGTPTEEEKRAYTLVLKGHIALASAIFPIGTTGAMLDVLARQFLWQEGKNYSHGTGHGVGYYSSVHEKGGFSTISCNELKAGMIISNEPGFYSEGSFGVRFENLMLIKQSNIDGFLEFEVLSKFGIEIALLNYDILTDLEIEWLTNYTNNL